MTTQTTQIDTHGTLPPQSERVLLYIAQGKTIADAARVLNIADGTAYKYVEEAKQRLEAETLPHAINLLWERRYLRRVAAAVLLLAIWMPLRQSLLDADHNLLQRVSNTARVRGSRRTSRARRARRNDNTRRHGATFEFDIDTGELLWPDSEATA